MLARGSNSRVIRGHIRNAIEENRRNGIEQAIEKSSRQLQNICGFSSNDREGKRRAENDHRLVLGKFTAIQ